MGSAMSGRPALGVLIADDEPLARERIRMLLGDHAGFRVLAEAGTGDDALAVIRRRRPDIVFLDISMPGLSGVQVAEELLGDDRPPAVVFVTAHDEFALQAFEVSAIDYLVKPIDRDRFETMLARVERRVAETHTREHRDELRALLETLRPEGGRRQRFVVRTNKGHYFVQLADVECAVAEGNYVALYAGGRQHLVRETMKSFEESVGPDEFVRIHRSVIVRIDAIARLEPNGHGEYHIHMKSGVHFESSRAYGDRLRALLR
jgi:two-component system LytT family response regulator